MDDLISRQAAIDEAVAYIEEWNNAKSEHHKKEITRRFQNLPSAQQKSLKYFGESICVFCRATHYDGCFYDPIEEVK